jgi:hypothetical protein
MTTRTCSRFALLAIAFLGSGCGERSHPLSPLEPTAAVVPGRSEGLYSGPARGTLQDGVTTYRGTLSLERFAVQGGQLVGVFSLEATLYDAAGIATGTVSEQATIAATASATCEELDLDIAPIRFAVMGQTIEIYEGGPFLNVGIAPGSGYYSTLLCQIAGQLERGTLQAASGLINQFLSLAIF